MTAMFENKRLCMTGGKQKVAMHLRVLPQNTPLIWQLNRNKHIGSIPELLRCCKIIVVTVDIMYVQVFRL